MTLSCLFAIIAPIPVMIVKMHVQYRLVIVEETGGYNVQYTNVDFMVSRDNAPTSVARSLRRSVHDLGTLLKFRR